MIEKKEVTSEAAFLYLKGQLNLSGKSLSNELEKIFPRPDAKACRPLMIAAGTKGHAAAFKLGFKKNGANNKT